MMANVNPYQTTSNLNTPPRDVNKVRIHFTGLFGRSRELLGDQYWLFLGIVLVGIFVGSMVPMGLIMGAMLIGIYLCYIQRELGMQVEFSTVFKGFDYFLESFLAFLVMMVVSIFAMAPFMIGLMALFVMPIMEAAKNPNGQPPEVNFLLFGILYISMFVVNFLVQMPLLFVFQLIVDRHLKAIEAIKMSIKGIRLNFFGILGFMFVLMIVSTFLSMLCMIPGLLFTPISFGMMFLLYRDIFGPGVHQGHMVPPPA